MISQTELKRLRALSQKKYREETGRFLVQGRKVVSEALQSSYRIELILASEDAASFIAALAAQKGVPVHVVSDLERDRVGTFEKGNELIAIAVKPKAPDFSAAEPNELILALDGVRDPRNMGGLLRIADWFGVRRVICSADCMEVFNPKCVQSTMGSLFRVEVRAVEDLAGELGAHHRAGAHIYIADMHGAAAFSTPLSRPAILVLGSESHGHSASVSALEAKVISIPRIGGAESLNVAMAASALCAEFARQSLLGAGF
jgi:TrmH family RNA methyltransferase